MPQNRNNATRLDGADRRESEGRDSHVSGLDLAFSDQSTGHAFGIE